MYYKDFPYRSHSAQQQPGMPLIQTAAEQEQAETSKSSTTPPKTDTTQHKTKVAEKGEKLKKDLDKIIDEIDDVLEENAEEFIKSYVQRGGE